MNVNFVSEQSLDLGKQAADALHRELLANFHPKQVNKTI